MCGITVGVIPKESTSESGPSFNDKFTSLGEITRVDNTFKFSLLFAWLLNNLNYTEPLEKEYLIDEEEPLLYRQDILCVGAANGLKFIKGESNPDTILPPQLPENFLLVGTWTIFGDVVGEFVLNPLIQDNKTKIFEVTYDDLGVTSVNDDIPTLLAEWISNQNIEITDTEIPVFEVKAVNVFEYYNNPSTSPSIETFRAFFDFPLINLKKTGETFTFENTHYTLGPNTITIANAEFLKNVICYASKIFDNNFYLTVNVQTLKLPFATVINPDCFKEDSIDFSNIFLPSVTFLGNNQDDENIFYGIFGLDITLTVPVAMMTVNGGNPAFAIQTLIENNNVTVITV